MAPFILGPGITRLTTGTPDDLEITAPTGPTTNIDLTGGGGGGAPALDIPLSFGHGTPDTADVLPEGEIDSFWLSPTTTATIATPGQIREWPVLTDLSSVTLAVVIDSSNIVADGASRLVVTVNGVATSVFVSIPPGPQSDLSLETTIGVSVPADARIGVMFEPGDGFVSGTLRTEVKVRGATTYVPPVLPTTNLVFRHRGNDVDLGVGDDVIRAIDISGNDRDVEGPGVGFANGGTLVEDEFGPGLDGISFVGKLGLSYVGDSGIAIDGPRTLAAVVKMVSSLGGPIVGVRVAIPFVDGNFNTYILEKAGTQYLQSNQNGGNITAPAPINYGSGVLICIWRWDGTGAPATLRMTVNGAPVALSSTTPTTPDNPTDGINIGGNANLFLDSRDIILAEDVGYNASSDELEAQLYAYLASIYLA